MALGGLGVVGFGMVYGFRGLGVVGFRMVYGFRGFGFRVIIGLDPFCIPLN